MDGMQTITSNLIKLKYIIIKLLAVAVFTLIVGCTPTTNQVGANKFETTCSGVFNEMQTCYNEAARVCSGKYTLIDKKVINQGDVWDSFCQCYVPVIARGLLYSCR